MKLTVVTVKQSFLVNLNGLYEHRRSVRNCDCNKNETAKHCWEADHNFNWDQKKVIDRESRLIPRKIKQTINSLKNPNHIAR